MQKLHIEPIVGGPLFESNKQQPEMPIINEIMILSRILPMMWSDENIIPIDIDSCPNARKPATKFITIRNKIHNGSLAIYFKNEETQLLGGDIK